MSDPIYIWADADESAVLVSGADADGAVTSIPATVGNRRYEALVRDGVMIRPYTAPAPDLDELRRAIDVERDRRVAAGVMFRGVAFQTDEASAKRIDKARTSALAAMMAGAGVGDLRWHGLPVDFIWIATDNSRLPMDAPTMVSFGNAVAAREGLLIVAANDLKLLIDGGETIADPTDDALWPAR